MDEGKKLPYALKDGDTMIVKQEEISSMLMDGIPWAKIARSLSCSQGTINKVAKRITRQHEELEGSTVKIMKARMLLTANKALSRLNEEIVHSDDVKSLQSSFNGLYDRAIGNSTDKMEHSINIQLSNMFGSPVSSIASNGVEIESPE